MWVFWFPDLVCSVCLMCSVFRHSLYALVRISDIWVLISLQSILNFDSVQYLNSILHVQMQPTAMTTAKRIECTVNVQNLDAWNSNLSEIKTLACLVFRQIKCPNFRHYRNPNKVWTSDTFWEKVSKNWTFWKPNSFFYLSYSLIITPIRGLTLSGCLLSWPIPINALSSAIG